MEEKTLVKTSPKGWLVFVIIFAYSVTVCMNWFSVPAPAIKYALAAGCFGAMTEIGTVMSAISLTALIMAFPAGWFIRKWGARNVILISMVFSIVGCAMAAASGSNYPLFLAGRIVAGVGVGLCGVSCTTLTSLWIADHQKGLALAIWGIWVPVGMLIVYNASGTIISAVSGVEFSVYADFSFFTTHLGDDMAKQVVGGIDAVYWIICALLVVEGILTFIVVRDPDKSQETEVSTERVPYSDPKVKAVIKQPQLWFLCIAWLVFNFGNMSFTNYLSNWIQMSGWGWASNAGLVSIVTSLVSACGIIAPFFGIVYDKITKYKKWLFVSFGSLCILLMCVFGMRAWGEWTFYAYVVFQVLGNCILIAGIRPYVPLLTGRGGATAVSFGFACVTFLQQLGNTLAGVIHSQAAAALSTVPGTIDLVGLSAAGWYVMVPVTAIGFICSLFIRLPKQAGGPQGGKPEEVKAAE